MSAFKQFINVSILPGSTALKNRSFLPIIVGSGTEIGIQTISEADQLLAFGYSTTDFEYKAAAAMLSQLPSPAEIKVYRKPTATSYVDALTALAAADPGFYAIVIESVSSGDQYAVGSWADSTKRIFIARSTSTSIGSGRNVNREAYIVHDKLKTVAVAKLASEPLAFVGATVPAIAADTYDLDVTVNGVLQQLAIALLITDDWDAIAGKIETALQSATSGAETVEIVDGKLVISGDPADAGAENTVVISAGTAGSAGGDLIEYIDENITDMNITIEDPAVGSEIYPDAAWVGRKLGKDPFLTWKWKQLSGIGETGFNLTEINTILDNNTNTVQKQAGATYTIEGKVTGTQIGFIDLIVGIDYIENDIQVELLKLFLDNESVELSDVGIGQVEQVIRGVLDRNGARGIIASLTEDSSDADKAKSDQGVFMYKVITPLRSEIAANDRANRFLNKMEFSYTVGGAIHRVDVDGKFES